MSLSSLNRLEARDSKRLHTTAFFIPRKEGERKSDQGREGKGREGKGRGGR